MELKEKLKSLRAARGLTQVEAGSYLGVSAQTVSKWERGLLSPEIGLLPRIAVFYGCSIDSLFDMDKVYDADHRKHFAEKIRALHAAGDFEGEYKAFVRETEIDPDCFENHTNLMTLVLRRGLFDAAHISPLLSLAARAEKTCTDDYIRGEINRLMVQICGQCEDPAVREEAKRFYEKLSYLRHSREVYARYVTSGKEYENQVKKNIFMEIECSIRQLCSDSTPAQDAVFYYKAAASLYEIVLDGKFGGNYDIPLLCDYATLIRLYSKLGQTENADEYFGRTCALLDRFFVRTRETSKLLYSPDLPGHAPARKSIQAILRQLCEDQVTARYHERIKSYIVRFDV